jgi:hypothetical protein
MYMYIHVHRAGIGTDGNWKGKGVSHCSESHCFFTPSSKNPSLSITYVMLFYVFELEPLPNFKFQRDASDSELGFFPTPAKA